VSDLPDDLQTVIDAWDNLPNAVKGGFLAMVKVTRHV
jgi:hypothetical protein